MRVYMGQIMAECDCTSAACEQRGYCMAERIEELEAQLANQIGYKEDYRVVYMKAMDDLHAAHAALPRAYRMGLEDAATRLEPKNPRGDWTDYAKQHHADAIDIRAIPTPTDLVNRAIKGDE